MTPDAALVRPGEELDLEALAAYLRGRLPGVERGISLLQFPGGHSNLTYLIQAGGAEYVLRRPPFGPIAPKAHDMAREHNVLRAVHPLYPLAPRPILLCEDPTIIGATFFLMQRRRGLILRTPVDNPTLIANATQAFLDGLLQLHGVPVDGLSLGNPSGFLERQVRGWIDRWSRVQTERLAEVDAVISWLQRDIPQSPPATLIHNDYKLDNIALKEDCPSQIEAVFDWEMATVGDPLLDLGVALTYWSHADMFTSGPGWPSREYLLEAYASATSRDLSRIVYYEVFGIFKLMVIAQQIYFRWLKGQTQDPRFATFDQWVRKLTAKASLLIEQQA